MQRGTCVLHSVGQDLYEHALQGLLEIKLQFCSHENDCSQPPPPELQRADDKGKSICANLRKENDP